MRVLIDININASTVQMKDILKKLAEAVDETGNGIVTASCLDRTNNGQFHEEFSNTETYKTSHHLLKGVHNTLVDMCEDQKDEIKKFSKTELALRLIGLNA